MNRTRILLSLLSFQTQLQNIIGFQLIRRDSNKISTPCLHYNQKRNCYPFIYSVTTGSSSLYGRKGRGGDGQEGGKKKKISKSNLPQKNCVVCGRPFTWRKKWERCWDEVTCCSKSCNAKRRSKSFANDLIEDI